MKVVSFFSFFTSVLILSNALILFPAVATAQFKKIKTIIVDPGHGGSDAGARGEYEGTLGSLEKDITLAISLKLVAELKKQLPEVTTIPTRTTDVFNHVNEKAKFANENHGDLFVCIHADAVNLKTGSRIIGYKAQRYTTVKYVGKGKKKKKIVTPHTREVPIREYYKIPTTRKGTSTLILAAHKTSDKIKALEASDMQFETDANDSSLNINYDSPEWKASALLYTQNYFKRSYQLATNVQDEVAATGRDNLGVWQRQIGLWVLQATQMPAVLIETGFIANYEDE
ncbi:MAG: N-acetylmuramoyl-L-alanine amidase, partial [Ginsengibacter sp.]